MEKIVQVRVVIATPTTLTASTCINENRLTSAPSLNMGATKSFLAPQPLERDGQTQWRSCSVLNSGECAKKGRNPQTPTNTYENVIVGLTIFLKT